MCPSGHTGIATGVTSWAFAENVRSSYLAQGGPLLITAYSPVPGENHTMQCVAGVVAQLPSGMTVPSVRCVGRYNAIVGHSDQVRTSSRSLRHSRNRSPNVWPHGDARLTE
jgi:hypothetical protein